MCDKLSAEEIAEVLDIDCFGAPEATTNALFTRCRYKAENYTHVLIDYYTDICDSMFEAGREIIDSAYPGWNTVEDTVIGDAAYSYSLAGIIPGDTATMHTVAALSGSIEIRVTSTSVVTLDKMKELAALIVSKL